MKHLFSFKKIFTFITFIFMFLLTGCQGITVTGELDLNVIGEQIKQITGQVLTVSYDMITKQVLYEGITTIGFIVISLIIAIPSALYFFKHVAALFNNNQSTFSDVMTAITLFSFPISSIVLITKLMWLVQILVNPNYVALILVKQLLNIK